MHRSSDGRPRLVSRVRFRRRMRPLAVDDTWAYDVRDALQQRLVFATCRAYVRVRVRARHSKSHSWIRMRVVGNWFDWFGFRE